MKTGRTGYTTGACAAAAAKAAAWFLAGKGSLAEVDIPLPGPSPGENRVTLPIAYVRANGDSAQAAVRKDAGDDPDVTNGALIVAELAFLPGAGVAFAAGEGVGRVTKPGLSVPPGEPAINPGPRLMIEQAIHEAIGEATPRGMQVTISIPGGEALAARTFNPRLGIVGGLSVLGTTGIVRPYSISALRTSLQCSLDVAVACGIRAPAFVPGNIGRKAVEKNFRLRGEEIVEVGNEWGFIIDAAVPHRFKRILVAGHPGKLVKLAAGQWDTHSARSDSAAVFIARQAENILSRSLPEQVTAEGIFAALVEDERRKLGNAMAGLVAAAVADRMARAGADVASTAAVLIDMRGRILGTAGDLSPWQ